MRSGIKVAADLAMWSAAGILAFPLRAPDGWTELVGVILAYVLFGSVLKGVLILSGRLHRQVWRHVTVEDVRGLTLVVALGTAGMFLLGIAWHGAGIPFPRTVPIIEGILALIGMGGVRIVVRMWRARKDRVGSPPPGKRPRRVLLVGAGEAGTQIGWEIRRRPSSGFIAVGFLDDNPAKAQLRVAGTRVLGRIEDLARVVRDHRIDEVFIAMPSADGRKTRRIIQLARSENVECRILPGITQVLSGDVTLAGVRPVQVEDLLRREPIELEQPASYIEGQTILVTGAGGSIGSELVRQTALLDPASMVLFGHSETALHRIHQELALSMPEQRITIVVGDVRERAKIDHVMRRFRPSVVFHAAAHKHVPLMEADPDEAMLNNVGGTRNLALAALESDVERFVNVSTDKAVRPTSVLGASKSLAEIVVRAAAAEAREGQSFVSVRFGNVLGSRGSVVEEFQDQIRRGGPVRVTDQEMSRFFMTIREASQLVIQSGALGGNGLVYVLNMGRPLRIVDLARDMIRLAGADHDGIQIVFTGKRPGEKLHEDLISDAEQLEETGCPGVSVARSEPLVGEETRANIDLLIHAAERRDWADLDHYVRVLLPGFRSDALVTPAGSDGRVIPDDVLSIPALQESQ